MNTKSSQHGIGFGVAAIAALLSVEAKAIDLPSFEGDVTIRQDASRLVTIDYKLVDASAVVTVDFLTNGVSIGEQNFAGNLSGDVNRLVTAGDRKILWRPDKDWPGHVFTAGEVTAKLRAWPVTEPPPYMIVDLTTPGTGFVEYRVTASGVPGGVNSALYKSTKMVLRKIPAAGRNWRLGTFDSSLGNAAISVPYTAAFSNDYYIAVFPMTVGQYMTLGGADPYTAANRANEWSYWKNHEHPLDYTPVYSVSHANVRTLMSGVMKTRTGVNFTLPTEAQWEVACRAGTTTATYLGNTPGEDNLNDYSCSVPYQLQVGTKGPNAWGLYGMLCGKQEYCLDWSADRTADDGSVKVDPIGPATGTYHVTKSSNAATLRHSGNRASDGAYGSYPYVYVFRCCAPAIAK